MGQVAVSGLLGTACLRASALADLCLDHVVHLPLPPHPDVSLSGILTSISFILQCHLLTEAFLGHSTHHFHLPALPALLLCLIFLLAFVTTTLCIGLTHLLVAVLFHEKISSLRTGHFARFVPYCVPVPCTVGSQ